MYVPFLGCSEEELWYEMKQYIETPEQKRARSQVFFLRVLGDS